VRAQSAELDGKATAVIGAAALCNHGQVFWREAPMPRQLVFARVERGRHGRFRVKSTESHPCSRFLPCVSVRMGVPPQR